MTILITSFCTIFGLITNYLGMESIRLKKFIVNVISVAIWDIIYLLLLKGITNNFFILFMPIVIIGLMLITALVLERIPLKRRKKNIYKASMSEIVDFVENESESYDDIKLKTTLSYLELFTIQLNIAKAYYLDELTDEEKFIAKFFDANYGDLIAKAISLAKRTENLSNEEKLVIIDKIYSSFDKTVSFVHSQFTEVNEESNNKIKEELDKTLKEFEDRDFN